MPRQPCPPIALTQGAGVQSTPGSRERGAEVFARACAGCHGTNGAGGERNGAIGGAINVPAFLALHQRPGHCAASSSPAAPTSACRPTPSTTAAPTDFQPLTSAEIDDLVALLAAWRATGRIVAEQTE